MLGHAIEVSVPSGLLADQARVALRDVPDAPGEPVQTLSVKVDGDRFELAGDTPWAGEGELSEAVPRLVTALNRVGLDATDDAVGLHAAGVVGCDGSHLLLARSGVGKTSLLVELLRLGHAGLTDEMVFLPLEGGGLRTWPKPLSIKHDSTIDVASDLDPQSVRPRSFRSVPISEVGAVAASAAPLRSFVFLERPPGHNQPVLEALTPGDALVAIGDHFLNFRRIGPEPTLRIVADAVATSVRWRLRLGDPTESAEVLDQHLGDEPETVPWSVLPEAPTPAVSGVITIEFPGEVVLWSPRTEQLVGLDSVAAELWRGFCIDRSDALLDHRAFAVELATYGFLDRDRMADRAR